MIYYIEEAEAGRKARGYETALSFLNLEQLLEKGEKKAVDVSGRSIRPCR